MGYDKLVLFKLCYVGGEGVAIRGGMEDTFKNNHYVILGCFCFTSMLEIPGKFWKNQEI